MTVTRCALCVLFCTLLLTGCFPGMTSKPPYTIYLYTLEYAAQSPRGAALGQVVRIDRFSMAQSYNTSAMLSRPEPYKVAAYNYHKWQTYPGDMVTDHLVEDFRSSGLFRAVLSFRDQGDYRFAVRGGVEEFVQAKEDGEWQVVLSLQVSLVDTERPGAAEKILFQRRYRSAVPIVKASPENFASGMSQAMSKVSSEILKDMYESATAAARGDQSFR